MNPKKNRVLIEICGREFALIAEESETYMKSLAAEVNQMINESVYKSLRTSKNDAALLICLDLCDKNKKLNDAHDNMREQITTYIEEIDKLKKELSKYSQQKPMKNNKLKSDAELSDSDEVLQNEYDDEQEEYKLESAAGTEEPETEIDTDMEAEEENEIEPETVRKSRITEKTGEKNRDDDEDEIESQETESKDEPEIKYNPFSTGNNQSNSKNPIETAVNRGDKDKREEKTTSIDSLKERYKRLLQKSMSNT